MSMNELKNKLLQTGLFIDNNQLDKYLELVVKNDASAYTERHHILPKSYFKLVGQKIDNSADNIIKLSYFNHILAHYYLSFCTSGRLKQANICAFIMLIDIGYTLLTEEEHEAILAIKHYAELKEQAIKIKKVHCRQVGRKRKTPEHRAALSAARDLHSTTKGKKSIYNPHLNKVKFVNIDEIAEYLNQGWQLGGKPLPAEAKLKIGKSNSIALKGKTHSKIAPGKKNSGLEASKILCVETGTIFNSIEEAKQWLKLTIGVDGGQIKNCCSGKRETTGGYHWKYYKD